MNESFLQPFLALVGPTASGKTEASIPLAEALGAEVVCVDSMLVYRGMDVGTAKPSAQVRARVPHHLVDLVDPDQRFSVAVFQSAARKAIVEVQARGRRPLLVGGTGLYYRAVVDGLVFPGTDSTVRALLESEGRAAGPSVLHRRLSDVDPEAASRIEPSNLRRTVRALEVAAVTGRRFSTYSRAWSRFPPTAVRAVGVDVPREILHSRIEERVNRMMPALLDEAATLSARGFGPFLTSSQAIGYAEALACVRGEIDPDEAAVRTTRRTKALARRQMAWFRRDPRIRWVRVGEGGAKEAFDAMLAHLEARDPQLEPAGRSA